MQTKILPIIFGINGSGLNGCINDVNNIRDRLSKKYLFEDITTMTDKTEVKPTKNNIVEGLKNLLSNNNPGDILFFSFSGHGTNTIDTSGDEKDEGEHWEDRCGSLNAGLEQFNGGAAEFQDTWWY